MHSCPNCRWTFLLLIDIPIQDHAQQIEIYEVFNLDTPHGNYSLSYDTDNKYLGITLDETSAIEILEDQFWTCKRVHRQLCILNTPPLPLANPPTCSSSLYTKDKSSNQKSCSLQVKKANSISIPTSITPNVWVIVLQQQQHLPESHSSALEKHPELSYHWHPFIY